MHELTIAENISKIVQKNLPDKTVKVYKIRLKVGKLTAVVPDALRFCFQAVAQGTPAAHATLEIEEVPARANCTNCNLKFTIDEPCFLCPNCHSGNIEFTSGRELFIQSFDIED